MNHYSIPSKWTKDDFSWAAFCATLEPDFDVNDVLSDVLDCFTFGYANMKRESSMRVNWSLLQGEVDVYRSGYYLKEH